MTQSGGRAAWFVYMLRCADGSLYTGITTDITRRVAEHNGGGPLGARYTRTRRPVELAYVEAVANRAYSGSGACSKTGART